MCLRLGLTRGRTLFNVGRYPEGCAEVPAHYDGELFDFDVVTGVGNVVRSALRPARVAVLTLRNDTRDCHTSLHEDDGRRVDAPEARAGDLLCFDNTRYKHGVPEPGRRPAATRADAQPRWIRYTVGWRALEENCFDWADGRPLERLDLAQAIERHERFLEDGWPKRVEDDVARGTFPYRSPLR